MNKSIALAVLSLAATTQAAPVVTPRYYQIILENCMYQGRDVRELVLDLEQIGEQWSAVYGLSRNYNMAYHKGAVKEARLSGDALTLTIGMNIAPDKWVTGGQGEYTVTLQHSATGTFTGKFSGTYNSVKVNGPATATL